MSKYDEEFRIDYDKITRKKEFFDALKKTKSATYNWGWDRLTSNGISISGEDFIQIAQVYAMTSADIIVVLLYNDIDVKIDIDYTSQYATFKSEQELQEFLKEMKHTAHTLKETK